MTIFEKDLAALINKHGLDRDTDTSDFILAQFLNNCLSAWNVSTNARDVWRGRVSDYTEAAYPAQPAPVAAQGEK